MYYPNIFICGPSGTGKSTSLRNLDPEKTCIINVEMEPLPFSHASDFTKQIDVPSLEVFRKAFEKAIDSKDIDIIVIDSFTSLAELMYETVVMAAPKQGDGILMAWAQYKDKLHQILKQGKRCKKIVVFIGHEDVIQDDKSRILKTIFVQGSLKGKVGKEFNIVLWTKVNEYDKLTEDENRYFFITNNDGVHPAKTPDGMIKDMHIPNDLNEVIKLVKSYYKSGKGKN